MKRPQAGFTLVEMIIVVAIIGILAAVAIPKFADMLEKSREGATKGGLASIRSGVANYYADQQGLYPSSLDTATFSLNGIYFAAFVPGYIDYVPGVKVTAKRTLNGVYANLGPGVGSSAANVTAGDFATPAFVATSAGKGWKYDDGNGDVWVNSSLKDMAGRSYTIFGSE